MKRLIPVGALLLSLACSSVAISIDPPPPTTAPPPTLVAATESAPTVAAPPAPTAASTAAPPTSAPQPLDSTAGPTLGGCPIFPPDHIWNTRVDSLPRHPNSDAYIDSIGRDEGLHPDFGSGLWEGGPIGIPFTIADASTPKYTLTFEYDDESDHNPYPIPDNAPIEGGPNSDGDRHILIVESSSCTLYEIYAAYPNADGSWQAGSGAIWDLRGYALRPDEWTSADAAGLPILPGLVRYDEAAAGAIRHAIRFTAENTRAEFVWPAKHEASDSDDPNLPPMGQRFRLKASFDISPYPAEMQAILHAMQTYGLILADNGSDWFISGAPDERWNNDELVPLFR